MHALHPVWWVLIGVCFNRVVACFGFLLLELAEVETSDRQGHIRAPFRDGKITFFYLSNQVSRPHHLHFLGHAHGHLVLGVVTKAGAGIPVLTCYRKIVPAAGINHSVLASINRADGERFTGFEGLGQDHGEIGIAFFFLLDESQRLATLAGHALHPQCREEIQSNHADAIRDGYEC